ncbi:Aspartate racemase [Senna tora]|uniref:Aspartate racemase n=1 Tax=Senna tora TaxID=362788 RepID=A0A834XDD2_9FABA|nr:Aspartate racemase [Senna tora]
MSFQTLNYPSHTLISYVNTPRTLYKARSFESFQVQASPPSSIILNADESGKFPDNNSNKKLHGSSNLASASPLVSQASGVGIIGGASVDATLKFLRKLVELSSEDDDDDDGGDSLPFVLCSDPVLNKELLAYDKSYFHHSGRMMKAENLKLDSSPIVHKIRNKRVFLEKSGASCIVMPCHLSHSWYEQVSKECSVPFLHMAECVAKELKEAKLKPLEAGSPLRIGLLATNATLAAGFYQEKLQNQGFEVMVPDKATMEHTVIPAIEALKRKDMEGACNLLRIALQVLLVRAVNSVVLASDDMWDLLPQDDPLLKKCVDPMDALARSTIKWVKSCAEKT